MLRNYLKIALRNTLNQKLLSFINIFSLAFGIAACLIIYLFIRDERSFDSFHSRKGQLYRLNEVQSFPGTNTQHVALIIALLTISFHTLRSARANPVEALRYE